jgi:limonene-1,2-epoxide hydrolase
MGEMLDKLHEGFARIDAQDLEGFRAAVREAFAEDAEIVEPMGTGRGPDQALAMWEPFITAFSNSRHQFLTEVEVDGCQVIELCFTGDNTGAMAMPDGTALPPTGRSVSLSNAVIVRTDNGRVVSWHSYFDQMAFLQQLGLIPEPAQV